MRAIDLYSGVGGWALGLQLAGIDVVASYELSPQANVTNRRNNGHPALDVDIRTMPLASLPGDIDLVVGSPPCTEFSFSNRGGRGDIADGLQDIARFLEIVDHVKPTFWVMENVPRTARIVQHALGTGGKLHRYAHLSPDYQVVAMDEWGVPQRRRRCLIGNIDFHALLNRRNPAKVKTLGEIIASLSAHEVVDPNYGMTLPRELVTENEQEEPLNAEEIRVNRATKTLHPVYNGMSFPDALSRGSRTITATCTRVSRESIVVACSDDSERYRRLTLRERACIQTFPISYQFYHQTNAGKCRMIGNAMPPLFARHIGQVCRQELEAPPYPRELWAHQLANCVNPPPPAKLDSPGCRYVKGRTFRFAIPSLRLGSGVRFDLTNVPRRADGPWHVDFYFGTPKDIQRLTPTSEHGKFITASLEADIMESLRPAMHDLDAYLGQVDFANLQNAWSRQSTSTTQPFELLDSLDTMAAAIVGIIEQFPDAQSLRTVTQIMAREVSGSRQIPGLKKLYRNAATVISGLLIGSAFNTCSAAEVPPKRAESLLILIHDPLEGAPALLRKKLNEAHELLVA